MGLLNHILVDLKNPIAVYETCVEPQVKYPFLLVSPMVEFYFNVVIDKTLFLFIALATGFGLVHGGQVERLRCILRDRLIWLALPLFLSQPTGLLMLVPQQLQVVIEVVHVSNLGRYRYSLRVLGPDLAVIHQRLHCIFSYKSVVVLLTILMQLVALEHQVATDHHSSAAFASLAVNSSHVLRVLTEPFVAVNAKLKNHVEGRRIMVIEGILFAHFLLAEECFIVVPLRAQIVNLVVTRVLLFKEPLDIANAVAVEAL
jgi:hypothetical protein